MKTTLKNGREGNAKRVKRGQKLKSVSSLCCQKRLPTVRFEVRDDWKPLSVSVPSQVFPVRVYLFVLAGYGFGFQRPEFTHEWTVHPPPAQGTFVMPIPFS